MDIAIVQVRTGASGRIGSHAHTLVGQVELDEGIDIA